MDVLLAISVDSRLPWSESLVGKYLHPKSHRKLGMNCVDSENSEVVGRSQILYSLGLSNKDLQEVSLCY